MSYLLDLSGTQRLLDNSGNLLTDALASSTIVATNFADSAPLFSNPTALSFTVNQYLDNFVINFGLSALHNYATTIHICKAAPVVYTDVATVTLGHQTFAAGSCFSSPTNALPSGSQCSSSAVSGVNASAAGTVILVAVTDDNFQRLLAYAPVTNSRSIALSQPFAIPSFNITVAGHA